MGLLYGTPHIPLEVLYPTTSPAAAVVTGKSGPQGGSKKQLLSIEKQT